MNPQENVWQFMRENWLSNRVFNSYPQILDFCCEASNRLIDHPWRIMSIASREWANRFLISESWYKSIFQPADRAIVTGPFRHGLRINPPIPCSLPVRQGGPGLRVRETVDGLCKTGRGAAPNAKMTRGLPS
jgi:hypothetical protein